jgi:hypothetical protein
VDKWRILIITIVESVLIGLVINTLLNSTDNSPSKTVLIIGLCIAGIIGLPFLIAQIFKQEG